jgi:hypothetical protein
MTPNALEAKGTPTKGSALISTRSWHVDNQQGTLFGGVST